tara:strand:+ start:8475 stop:8744 length:270 start_codon:yes stop_codon:yes gene_type:complete
MDISNKHKLILLTHRYGSEDLYIEIPRQVRKDLNWKEGDTLIWEIQSDNSIVIRKELSVSEYKEEEIARYLQEEYEKDPDSFYQAHYEG